MDIQQLKNQLQKYGLKPNFTYGQNFLVDEIVMQDIVEASGVTKHDAILEIGPGIGNLTQFLVERAGFVLSIEKDPKFFPVLKSIKKDHKENFWFEIADALEFNFQDFFKERGFNKYSVVANIPYFITGKILKMLMTSKFKPTTITLLTQKEVARNVVARQGDLSIIAISVQLYGEPKIIQIVPAKSFHPAPKVDSAVLQIKVYDKTKYDIPDEKKLFSVIKACFAGKRKQIHNTLVNNLHLTKKRALEILTELKINPSARPQELSIEDWISLTEKISALSS